MLTAQNQVDGYVFLYKFSKSRVDMVLTKQVSNSSIANIQNYLAGKKFIEQVILVIADSHPKDGPVWF